MEKLNNIDKWGADQLRHAIVEKAISDYARGNRLLAQAKAGDDFQRLEECQKFVDDIEKFFLSEWFTFICDLDGQTLLNSLKSRKVNRQLKIQERAIRNKNEKRGKDKESKG